MHFFVSFSFAINPNDKKLKLLPGTRGFFFAQDASDVAK